MEMFSKSHHFIGLLGLIMLFLYLILSFISDGFRAVFFRGLSIFVSFIKDWNMIFVIAPIYLNWISTDYFQEFRGTGFRNAISNGVMGAWVCISWIRTAVMVHIAEPNIALLVGKILVSMAIFTYAIFVVKESYKGRSIVHLIGRSREISYLALMITPIIHSVIPLEWITLLAILLLFPVFYGLVDFLEFTILSPPKFRERKIRKRKELL